MTPEHPLRRLLRDNWLPLTVLAVLILLPHLIGWATGSSPLGIPRGDRMVMRGESVRWQAVFIEIFILSILAMSYNLLFGFTGVVSFGHALFFGLGGYIVGLFLEYTDLPNGTALLLGTFLVVVVCATLSVLIGLVSLRLRGVYFAIFTLAVAEMFFIYFGRLALTKAEDGFAISELPTWLDPAQNRLNVYYLALVLFALTFAFIQRLVNSPTGAVFKAIRENEDRAQSIGFNTLTFKLLSIAIAGTLAGLAGILQILLNKKVGPELLGVSYTVDPLLMTIIGGVGTFIGPVVGASSLHLLDTILRDRTFVLGSSVFKVSDYWGLLLGSVFILVVIIFPQGIVGTWTQRRARRRAARAAPAVPGTPH